MQKRWESKSYIFKSLGTTCFALVVLLVLRGAGCVSNLSPQSSTQELPQPEPMDTTGIPLEKVGISLYNPAGLRKEPGKNKYTKDGELNYITGIYYGEMVEIIDTPAVEVKNKDYIMVRLQGGTVGWTHEYLIERYARRAVMTAPAELYRRPDRMTLRGDKLLPGQIIVVIEDPEKPGNYGKWLHVSSLGKQKKGWILRENNLTFDPNEVEVAMRFYRANKIYRADERREALGDLLQKPLTDNSVFLPMIEKAFKKTEDLVDPKLLEKEEFEIQEEKLFITQANIWLHAEPDENEDQGLIQLSEDDVCVILGRGDRGTIGEISDYWYRVRHDGTEGWVFGYYTSRRDLSE